MIAVNNLTFGYNGSEKAVFKNFNLQLEPGCICGLLGRNATGKSTLLYLISGLLKSYIGEVTIDGERTDYFHKSVLEKIYLVPEEFDLPKVKLSDYIKMYRPFYKNFSQEVMDSCLREFDLNSDMKLDKLSMGTKKKVMMSFALATNTQILLMDEPTNGLDIPSKRQFRKVIANNMTEGRTLIISTHQVHDVEMLLDHVCIISNDGLLLNASMQEISDQYTFGTDPVGEVLYSEKTVDGEMCVARRTVDEEETPVNLELLFEYLNESK